MKTSSPFRLIAVLICVLAFVGGSLELIGTHARAEEVNPPAAEKKPAEKTPAEKITALEAEIVALKAQVDSTTKALNVVQQQRNQVASELLDTQARLALLQAANQPAPPKP